MPRFIERLSTGQRQWLWFFLLWCGGLGAVLILSAIIKIIMPS